MKSIEEMRKEIDQYPCEGDCDDRYCGNGAEKYCRSYNELDAPDDIIVKWHKALFPEQYPAPTIKDSGKRREFESGAVRDIQEGKGRCDLLPLDVVSDCFRFGGFNEEADVFGYIYEFQQTGDVKFLLWAIDAASIFNNSWTEMFLEVSKHFEEGAKKYGENNWQKGLPVNCYIDSAVRHYLKHLHGDTDEPHDRAFVWNLMCCVWTVKHIENGGNNHDYE